MVELGTDYLATMALQQVGVPVKEYQKNQATIKLLSKLMEAEKAIKISAEWLTGEQVKYELGV